LAVIKIDYYAFHGNQGVRACTSQRTDNLATKCVTNLVTPTDTKCFFVVVIVVTDDDDVS